MAYYKRHILLSLLTVLLALGASGQSMSTHTSDQNILNHLDIGLSAGSTGITIDASVPVTDWARLRLGYGFIPHLRVPMTFNLMAYAGTDEDTQESQENRFNKLSALMRDFTGFEIDRKVDMDAKGTMSDLKVLVDVFPLRSNRHFFATAGFYYGSSKVGHIQNNINESPSLVGAMIYNQMHDFFLNYDYLYKPLYGDIYFDPMTGDVMREKFVRYGRVGAHMGDFNSSVPYLEGQPYMLEPDANGMVRADMYVNRFKPYLGLGYTCDLGRNWHFSVEAGALFWGKPRILTHERYQYGTDQYGDVMNGQCPTDFGDYVDVAKDVDNISGKVGDYVTLAKAIHVYPALNIKLSYTIF